MNKFITKQGSRLAALVAGVVLFSFTTNAQNLENNATGKVNNTGTGKIVFKNATGSFDNDAPIGLITNDGVIEMLGTGNTFTGGNILSSTPALRVPGMVSYAANAGNQNIFDGFYTDLDMVNGATKTFAVGSNAYYVGGNYTAAGADRIYTGSVFTYDGAGAAQSVAAENATNGGGYNNLAFDGSALKEVKNGATLALGTTTLLATATGGVNVDNTTANSTSLTSTGVFTQANGAADFTLVASGTATLLADGNLIEGNTQVNDGTLILGNGSTPANTTIQNGGSLNLANDANALLNLTAEAIMNVDGTFANLFAARTNMTFDGTSLVDYQNGASTVVTTANSNPYGQFEISKSNGVIDPDGGTNNIEVATSFAMNGGGGNNLDMLNNGGGYVNMLSGTANNVTYAANEEVVGEFRRTHAFTPGQDNVFNNAATIANFASSTGNFFSFIVNPDGQTASYVAATDVDRDININYDLTAWVADITAGYQAADVTTLVSNGNTEAQIRFREGNAIPEDEKVSTGNAYIRTASGAGSLGSVQLPAMEYTATDVNGLPDAGFFASNDLILRAGPAIWYSVNPGRWSNPDTWDEGTEPPTDAEVVVRHNVHAGFIRAVDAYATPEAFPNAMATKITIQNPNTDPTNFPTPTLIIGKNTTDGTYPVADFATSTAAVTGITNPGRIIVEQVAPTGEVAPATLTEATIDVSNKSDYIAGLVVYENSEITASESLINDGCLNIGGTLGIGQ